MGCVLAKPSGGLEARGLDRLKLENGYVGNGDFAAHRRSMGQRYDERRQLGRLDQRELRKHRVGSGIGNEGRGGSSNSGMREGKRNGWSESFDDEMVDGWPRWLVDNVPRDVLAGLVPRSAESYKMIDKVFVYEFCEDLCSALDMARMKKGYAQRKMLLQRILK